MRSMSAARASSLRTQSGWPTSRAARQASSRARRHPLRRPDGDGLSFERLLRTARLFCPRRTRTLRRDLLHLRQHRTCQGRDAHIRLAWLDAPSAAQAFELTPNDKVLAGSSCSHFGGFNVSLSGLTAGARVGRDRVPRRHAAQRYWQGRPRRAQAARRRRPRTLCKARYSTIIACRVSSRSASSAGLSQRMRWMRGKRMATPDLWRLERCTESKATSNTSFGSTCRTGPNAIDRVIAHQAVELRAAPRR